MPPFLMMRFESVVTFSDKNEIRYERERCAHQRDEIMLRADRDSFTGTSSLFCAFASFSAAARFFSFFSFDPNMAAGLC